MITRIMSQKIKLIKIMNKICAKYIFANLIVKNKKNPKMKKNELNYKIKITRFQQLMHIHKAFLHYILWAFKICLLVAHAIKQLNYEISFH